MESSNLPEEFKEHHTPYHFTKTELHDLHAVEREQVRPDLSSLKHKSSGLTTSEKEEEEKEEKDTTADASKKETHASSSTLDVNESEAESNKLKEEHEKELKKKEKQKAEEKGSPPSASTHGDVPASAE